jgi:hypothetical protein
MVLGHGNNLRTYQFGSPLPFTLPQQPAVQILDLYRYEKEEELRSTDNPKTLVMAFTSFSYDPFLHRELN